MLGLALGAVDHLSAPVRRRRPWLLRGLLAALALAGCLALGWALRKDIHFDAIDYRPLLLAALGLITGVVASRWPGVSARLARASNGGADLCWYRPH